MPWDLLIRNGQAVTRAGVERLDLAIEAGKIVETAVELHGAARAEVDARDLHIFPGVIDPHVHFNEPGRTEWEGFATGSAALAAGGGTCFIDMPLNAHPPTVDAASFDAKHAAALNSSRCDFAFWGGIVPSNLDHLAELAERGVVGFKAFMSDSGIDDFACVDDRVLKEAMQLAAQFGVPVAVHAESNEMTTRLTADARRRGAGTWRDYLATRPIEAEVEAINRAIGLAGETGCLLHIVHVSSVRGVELVHEARQRGVDMTCETCPHYLLLCEEDLERIGAAAKCAPPVRSADECAAMWAQLAEGKIAFVASDHSPSPPEMKTSKDAFAVWGGIAGVQSTLAILLSHEPELQLDAIAKLTATNVADRFDLSGKGAIEIGMDADLAIVDLAGTYTLTREMLHDRHKLSPYVGRSFRGVVRRTMVRGNTVFLDGKPVDTGFRGRLVGPAGGGAA